MGSCGFFLPHVAAFRMEILVRQVSFLAVYTGICVGFWAKIRGVCPVAASLEVMIVNY